MKTAFESIKRGLHEAIEHVEQYKPVPFDPHALVESACKHDDRSSSEGSENDSDRQLCATF